MGCAYMFAHICAFTECVDSVNGLEHKPTQPEGVISAMDMVYRRISKKSRAIIGECIY